MKKVNLLVMMILLSSTGLWAQTAYNPFTQNINFLTEPLATGFSCGSLDTVQFTQGITTADDATQWQTQPLRVKIQISGFEFASTNANSVVFGSYTTFFNWSFSGDTLIGVQNQTLEGTGTNPLFPKLNSSGLVNVALKVPETSPINTPLIVNVTMGIPQYMVATNSVPDDNESTQTQTYCQLSIKGTVYHDTLPNNGTIDKDRAITSQDNISLCANLIGSNDSVLATKVISPTGTYEFSNVAGNSIYRVILTNVCGTVGQLMPTPTLPINWQNTGEDCCDGVGQDFNPDGILTVPVTDASKTQADFGIRNLTPTPVLLTTFNATEYNCNVIVAWTTASEENVSHFDLLRKDNASGVFTKIGKVPASGSSTSEKMYNFVDKDVEKGMAYNYQLSMVDNDGSQKYSNVQTVKLICGGDEVSAQIFPNPAKDNLNLVYTTLENDVQLVVDVVDVTGRKIASKSQIIFKGTSVINFDIKGLATGHYMVRYHSVEGNITNTIKFTKE